MRYLVSALASLLFSLTVSAQSSGLVDARTAMTAAIARQDRPAFARFLSEDITSIDTAGKLRNKAAAVDEMPSGNSQSPSEVSVYNDGAVVAIGYARAGSSPARIIQVWARKGDQWQMVAFQGVRAISDAMLAAQPSSALPPSSGSESDRTAVQRTLESARRAANVGDAKTWGSLVTDKFVATSPTAGFQGKTELMRNMAAAAHTGDGLHIEEISIRIHGNVSVATMRLSTAEKGEFWRTAVVVNEGGRWLQAAEMTTAITGAACSRPR